MVAGLQLRRPDKSSPTPPEVADWVAQTPYRELMGALTTSQSPHDRTLPLQWADSHPSLIASGRSTGRRQFEFCVTSSSPRNHADATPAPWCAPRARATIAPVSRMSCTSCSTPRLLFLARDHTYRRTFSYIRVHSLLCQYVSFTLSSP